MSTLSELQREQLSAYIDGMLPEAERGQLEQLLQSDAGLAAELRELQTTAAMLRDLPPARPPRSFTLDPATVAPRRSFGLPWTRWAALVGALALFLTVGLSALNNGTASPASDSMARSSAGNAGPAATSAPAAEAPAADSAGGAMPPAPMAAQGAPGEESAPLPTFELLETPASGSASGAAPANGDMATISGTVENPVAGGAPPTDLSETLRLAPSLTTPYSSSVAGGAPADPYYKIVTDTDAMGNAYMQISPLEQTNPSSPDASDMLLWPDAARESALREGAPAASADEYPNLGLLFGLLALAGVVGALALSLASRRLDRRD